MFKSICFILQTLALVFFIMLPAGELRAQGAEPGHNSEKLLPNQMPYLDVVPDPLEGVNRSTWAGDVWLFRGIIYPLSAGYHLLVPKPLRTGINNLGHNLTYPVRLFNNCCQGKWPGAWAETERFAANSTVGIGGLFDPATHWKIARSDEDFGETLGHYGTSPGFYLVLPVIGPSNGRDALGKLVDVPFDICFWIGVAYPHDTWADAPRPSFGFGDINDQAWDYKLALDSLEDPYQFTRTIYTMNRQRLILDYQPDLQGDYDPDPAVRSALFKPVIPDFARKGVTRRVLVPATGKKLAYSCWMQPHPAPLVCYIPGLGAYRLDRAAVAYADMLYRHGYSVVAISSPFQKEFMDAASTVAVPGYGPADCDDVVNALKLVLADVRKWQGDQITGTSLTGVSHGAYLTLLIAARESAGQLGGLAFDHYVAVNPPVELAHSAQVADALFDAPLVWPPAERRQRMETAAYKALYFADHGLDASGNIPLTRTESDYLIGLALRYSLYSAIEDSQRRHNLGVLQHDPTAFIRQDSSLEIRQIDFVNYLDRFVLPCMIKDGRVKDRAGLIAKSDLASYADYLRDNPKIRVQICDDDFLLTPENLSWFRSTFGDRLTEYRAGGHLGNLHLPAVQAALVGQFAGQPAK